MALFAFPLEVFISITRCFALGLASRNRLCKVPKSPSCTHKQGISCFLMAQIAHTSKITGWSPAESQCFLVHKQECNPPPLPPPPPKKGSSFSVLHWKSLSLITASSWVSHSKASHNRSRGKQKQPGKPVEKGWMNWDYLAGKKSKRGTWWASNA